MEGDDQQLGGGHQVLEGGYSTGGGSSSSDIQCHEIKYLGDGRDSEQQYLPGMSTGEGNKCMGKGQQIRGRGLPTARVTW